MRLPNGSFLSETPTQNSCKSRHTNFLFPQFVIYLLNVVPSFLEVTVCFICFHVFLQDCCSWHFLHPAQMPLPFPCAA